MRGGFTQVPNAILRGEVRNVDGKPLSPSARLLYALILDLSNGGDRLCTASQRTFGRWMHRSERQVHTLLKELEGAGLIRVDREGKGLTNTLSPLVVPPRKDASGHPRKSASDKQHLPTSNTEKLDEGERSGRNSQQGASA